MLDVSDKGPAAATAGPPSDSKHLAALEAQGWWCRPPDNKDTEIHPLVLAVQGGLAEDARSCSPMVDPRAVRHAGCGRRWRPARICRSDGPSSRGNRAGWTNAIAIRFRRCVRRRRARRSSPATAARAGRPAALPVPISTPGSMPRPISRRRSRHARSGDRRAEHGHVSGSSKPPTGSVCAWRRGSAAPAATSTGANTTS